MSSSQVVFPAAAACLNCGAELHGRFCSACGQRTLPPYPPMRSVLAEWWHEMIGWDGRYVRTMSVLLRRPGRLTVEVIEGHWARYVPPVRLYLLASLVYFLVNAAAPQILAKPQAAAVPGSSITINLTDAEGINALTPEQRTEVLRNVERAPRPLRPLFRSVLNDPGRFRARVLANLPRLAFVLVPVFAAIVAVVYRRRPFSLHLVFALHLHTAMFVAMAIARLSHVSWSTRLTSLAGLAAFLFVAWYAVAAFRRVYREPWGWIAVKAVAIAVAYILTGAAAVIATIFWSALGPWS